MGAGGNLFQIGTADTAGVNADQDLSGADSGNGDRFETDVVHAAVDGGLHGRGDRVRKIFNRILSGNSHRSILDDLSRGFASKQEDGMTESNEEWGGVRQRTFARARFGKRGQERVAVQFGLRIRPAKREIPSTSLRAGSSLRLKSGYAQDDRAV